MRSTIAGQLDLLKFIVSRFIQEHIRYLMTGSLAVSAFGYPRATHDIDFVVVLETRSLSKLRQVLRSLGPDFLQNPDTLGEDPDVYTIQHHGTGIKIDLWLKNTGDFSREWKRRHVTKIGKLEITLVSPEDLILTKLLWCKEVPSERHMRDCVGMWKVQKGKLDETYLFAQAKTFGIGSLLKEVSETKEY